MFRYLLSSIGINGMTVDTLVNKSQFARNEQVQGIIQIKRDDHRIGHIELKLIERIKNDDETSDFATYDHILNQLTFNDEGRDEIRFSFPPPAAIKSLDHQFVIVTQLFIEDSIDAYDEDEIQFV